MSIFRPSRTDPHTSKFSRDHFHRETQKPLDLAGCFLTSIDAIYEKETRALRGLRFLIQAEVSIRYSFGCLGREKSSVTPFS